MGFLDPFNGLDENQKQGLLAAAASLLQNSGPSTRPVSTGQLFGGALQAYQGGLDSAAARQQQALQNKLFGFKVADAESDLKNQELARQRAEDLRQFYIKQGGGVQSGSAQNPSAMGNNLAPTVQNASAMDQIQQQAATPSISDQKQGIYQQRLALAQQLRNAGFAQEADAQEAAALKFQPKVKGWEKVTQNGRVLFAPFFEDGTSGAPVPLDVAEKLQFQSTGGQTLALNPFTAQKVASFQNTQSPGEAASNSIAAQRLAFEKQQAAQPIFNIDAGGFVQRPDQANPNGKLLPVAGIGGKAPTEFQGKSAAFGLRATEADKTLNALEGSYDPAKINAKNSLGSSFLGGGIIEAGANKLLSAADQRAEQAQRDFINAILRQESGAAIGASEFDNARRQYFPQPGDTPAVIQQKATNRALAIQGLQANAGRAALTAAPKAGGWSIQKVD